MPSPSHFGPSGNGLPGQTLMRLDGVDEPRETRRPAVGTVRRKRVEAVVAPPALARKGRDGHQLDRRHAELAERPQPRHDAGEGPLRGEGADVELVEDELVQLEPRPGRDLEPGRVEQPRRSAHALRLPARMRVRPGVHTVEEEAVVVARESVGLARPDPVADLRELRLAAVEPDGHRARERRPDAKGRASVR